MTSPSLHLQDWRAWLPDGDAERDARIVTDARPAGRSLPAMLRRRVNLAGRAVADLLAELDPGADSILLHASRHGDGERTLELLYALAEDAPLSPARFGLSVHNAVLGVYSIASGNRRSLQAIAAGGDELAALFSEARGYLAEGAPQVVAVFSDVPVPSRFAGHAPASRGAAALAMRLALDTGPVIHESPWPGGGEPPQPADAIAWLRDGGELGSPLRGRAWRLAP
ncbi:beta-ketoacyl synthase chain length factor [Modicisalibacter sp. 'Wilcox']|uniref:beta-ketoacyl synthase chain length factor n=1 Tax=Modicisalibacter sp. 'Wilcox' TaxID=2679914 RepID=UPI0013D14D20|nr:beta-ketoacyl synthase chain length factor [Modicisalibacter sp. 'Wilcox']